MLIIKLIALLIIWIVWSIACAFALCFATIATTLEALSERLFPRIQARHLPIARQSSQIEKQRVGILLDPEVVEGAIGQEKLSPLVNRLLKNHLNLD